MAEKKKVGRPRGKKSNPNYTRVVAYIRRDVDKRMRHLIIDADLEISEAVEQALIEWLEKREGKSDRPPSQ